MNDPHSNDSVIVTHKNIGETPLEALERVRKEQGIAADIPMTYAGRLDPMAEGKLIILVGDECKKSREYTGLDKTYQVDILFGIETDTYDVLGLVQEVNSTEIKISREKVEQALKKYIGKITQIYPAYSSKTVKGRALHDYARAGEIDMVEKPTRDVTVYSIDVLDFRKLPAETLVHDIRHNISLVSGDFRQEDVLASWEKVKDSSFVVATIVVACSAGTYMRTLAHDVGRDVGCGAIAFAISRLKIGDL